MFRTVKWLEWADIRCKLYISNFVSYVLADVIIFVCEVPFIFWHDINVDEVSWITLKKLLQSAMDSYHKLRQLFYHKVRDGLSQIATGITRCDRFITNCDRYYKVRWLLQIAIDRQTQPTPPLFISRSGSGTVFSKLRNILFFWGIPLFDFS